MASTSSSPPQPNGGVDSTSNTQQQPSTNSLPHRPSLPQKVLSQSTQAIHADDHLMRRRDDPNPNHDNNHDSKDSNSKGKKKKINGITDVAPAMHVSTTFHLGDDPDQMIPFWQMEDYESFDQHIYSRDTAPNATRLEAVLSTLLKGRAVCYGSGLAAYFGALVRSLSSISFNCDLVNCLGGPCQFRVFFFSFSSVERKIELKLEERLNFPSSSI